MMSFALCPLQADYNIKPANGLLEQALVGGFARQRIHFINNVHEANVSVLLNNTAKQQYFWAFWRTHTLHAPSPFIWRLIFDDTEAKDYVCQFVADSLDVGERDGIIHRVSFRVRAKPALPTSDFDHVILHFWQTGDSDKFFNYLEKLVNDDLPSSIRGL